MPLEMVNDYAVLHVGVGMGRKAFVSVVEHIEI